MAIDTDAEKYCMLAFGTPFLAPVPIATGTIGEDEQAAFLGMFWEGLETGEGGGGSSSTRYRSTLAIFISIIFGGYKWR